MKIGERIMGVQIFVKEYLKKIYVERIKVLFVQTNIRKDILVHILLSLQTLCYFVSTLQNIAQNCYSIKVIFTSFK